MKLIQRREKEEVKKKTRKSIKKTCNQEPNTTKGRRGRKRKNIQKPEWISTNEVLDDLKLELVTDDSEFPVELFQRDQPSTCEVSNLNLSAIHPPLTQIWGKTLTKERENTLIASIPSSSWLRAKEGATLSKESSHYHFKHIIQPKQHLVSKPLFQLRLSPINLLWRSNLLTVC